MDIIKTFRWQDVIDILIVWVVSYRLLLFLRGTRAIQMLIGLSVLLAASILAGYLKLYTLGWLIQDFWNFIIIALIILFQPEIRRALAQVGEASFLTLTPAQEIKTLDEIVKAAVSLSARKIGALVVFERELSLQDYIEIGIPLDSKVSRELILTIFHPTSPIHDGAVVIKGNRMVAAGCFLPITLRRDIDNILGTRHRAAIAITEETDCIALIVSEETGDISISSKGSLDRKLDMTALRTKLTEFLTSERKKS
ncbi:hypothetical protein MCHI_003713 [Candidatus Magnetoovum chiemensis]|nr:hypothetical protein MCHI_003713 [Candidatus Magnetoovum chiemensis]